MGFATLVNMWIYVCVPAWGPWAAIVAWVLWMIDAVISVLVTLSMSILLYIPPLIVHFRLSDGA